MKTLKQKILIPLCLLGIICLYMSVNSYISTRMISETNDTLDVHHEEIMQLQKVDMRVQELQKLLLSLAVMDDMQIKPLVAETGEASLASLNAAMEAFKPECEDELESYNQLKSDLNVLIQYYQEAAKIALGGDNAGAIAMANNEVMYSAKTVEEEIVALIDDLETEVSEKEAYQQQIYNGITIANLVIFIIAVVIIVLSVLICTKLIIKPTKIAMAQMKEITDSMKQNRGNLNARIDIKTQDEIGQLSAGINAM